MVLNSHLLHNCDHIPGVPADMESECTMFFAAIAKATVWNCGCKIAGGSHVDTQQTRTRDAVKLNKESDKAR